MHFVPNIFILVAAYRLCNHMEKRGATLLGLATGVVIAVIACIFTSLNAPFWARLLVHSIAAMIILAVSFRIAAGTNSMLVSVLNTGGGACAALVLPLFVEDWILES